MSTLNLPKSTDLCLRTVESMRGERFFVPAYQRGYRWTERQVADLLEDVGAFAQSGAKLRGEFYCLQPVVVSRRDDGWEVVDGQQRLTTLYILLSYFNTRRTEEYREKWFDIEYDTRPASSVFLKAIRPEEANQNIDFFHMERAANTIKQWFHERQSIVNDCESAFRNDVKVIWYEIAHDVKATDAFRRLNVGKIPLADAELVKALFLRAGSSMGQEEHLQRAKQFQIAMEWDSIERRLQHDDFWFFLTSKTQSRNRIDLLLRLHLYSGSSAKASGVTAVDSLFLDFDRRLKNDVNSRRSEWLSVQRAFQQLTEWFEDPVMHHLVGFLAGRRNETSHKAIEAVVRIAARAHTKQEIEVLLKDQIRQEIFPDLVVAHGLKELRKSIAEELAGIEYSPGNETIRRLLLLFNLATHLGTAKPVRFPFDVFKSENWDIEHIRAVSSRMPERVDDQKQWLTNVLEFFGDDGELDPSLMRARELLESERFDGAAFAALFDHLREEHDPGRDSEVDNGIGNLTLLDAETNRSYGNAMFPLKRRRVVQRDMRGEFVPLCTKNVFLKYYTPNIDRMLMWTAADGAAYESAMADRLAAFFDNGARA